MATTMGRARLGRTNLDVSVVSLGAGGTSRLGQEYGASVEDSVNLVRTALDEGIDVFHLHGVSPDQYAYCAAEFGPELARLKQQGKIRFAGIAERFRVDPGHRMLQQALADEADVFDVVLVGLNLLNQTALTQVLPRTRARDIGTQLMYAVRGRLATPAGADGLIAEAIAAGEVDPAELDPERPLGFLLDDPSVHSLVDACYRFNRHAPGADVILTSTGRAEHLRENIASINSGPLPEPILDRLHKIFGRVESLSGD